MRVKLRLAQPLFVDAVSFRESPTSVTAQKRVAIWRGYASSTNSDRASVHASNRTNTHGTPARQKCDQTTVILEETWCFQTPPFEPRQGWIFASFLNLNGANG
jgi:hypothetical protein